MVRIERLKLHRVVVVREIGEAAFLNLAHGLTQTGSVVVAVAVELCRIAHVHRVSDLGMAPLPLCLVQDPKLSV